MPLPAALAGILTRGITSKLANKLGMSQAPMGLTGVVTGKTIQESKNISMEILGYDFVSLFTKLIVFFGIAWAIELYIKAAMAAKYVIPTTFFGIGGFIITWLYERFTQNPAPSSITDNEIILKVFSPEGYNGFRYWDIVKGLALLLVAWEGYNYYTSQEKAGGSASPVTLGIFGLISGMFAILSLPKIIQNLKMFNLIPQYGGGGVSDGNGAGR